MSDMPLVSVVIPVYNTEKYLTRCLDSVLAQTYKNLEIIIVNDGSPDGSPALCDAYAQKDARIKVIHQENRGLAGAVKRGIEASLGGYIGFVDSDDFVAEDMFEKLAAAATEHNADLVQCNYYNFFESGKTEKVICAVAPVVFERPAEIKKLAESMLGGQAHADCRMSFNRWTKLFRAALLGQNADYYKTNVKIGEDLLCTFPALADAEKVVLIPDCLYYYFHNASSMTKGFKPTLARDYANILETLNAVIAAKNLGGNFTAALKTREYGNKLNLVRNTCRAGVSRREKKAEIKRLHKSMNRVKLNREGIKSKLALFGLEALLALRLYGLITLLIK